MPNHCERKNIDLAHASQTDSFDRVPILAFRKRGIKDILLDGRGHILSGIW